jgi:hypothetical protein
MKGLCQPLSSGLGAPNIGSHIVELVCPPIGGASPYYVLPNRALHSAPGGFEEAVCPLPRAIGIGAAESEAAINLPGPAAVRLARVFTERGTSERHADAAREDLTGGAQGHVLLGRAGKAAMEGACAGEHGVSG